MQAGKLPNEDWQVHHVKPLDDGGTNSYDNLVLIKNEPYHKVLTNAQRTLTGKTTLGESKVVEWPMIDGDISSATTLRSDYEL
ncbi:HNH endonuclease signature motif containing protein [Pseudomonas sp. UBA1879]|uniref:HNH endonuclease n=1 Tax=Pseudomonas sp. UBA1879 TaxID=1947305 RepID=UPI0032E4C704